MHTEKMPPRQPAQVEPYLHCPNTGYRGPSLELTGTTSIPDSQQSVRLASLQCTSSLHWGEKGLAARLMVDVGHKAHPMKPDLAGAWFGGRNHQESSALGSGRRGEWVGECSTCSEHPRSEVAPWATVTQKAGHWPMRCPSHSSCHLLIGGTGGGGAEASLSPGKWATEAEHCCVR